MESSAESSLKDLPPVESPGSSPKDLPPAKSPQSRLELLPPTQSPKSRLKDLPPAEIPLTPEDQSKVNRVLETSGVEHIKINDLMAEMDLKYKQVALGLKTMPEVQERCLNYLLEAENILIKTPLERSDFVKARLAVTRVTMEQTRHAASRSSFVIVLVIIYIVAVIVGVVAATGSFKFLATQDSTNPVTALGIPLQIWVWSIIGSLTSMLLRAGQFPFVDSNEAYRWLLFRPIVGVVMGVLTYLMVITGLIVFAGGANLKTPELLWVIAFLGSFSDTLSINLLQRILGQFQTVGKDGKDARS